MQSHVIVAAPAGAVMPKKMTLASLSSEPVLSPDALIPSNLLIELKDEAKLQRISVGALVMRALQEYLVNAKLRRLPEKRVRRVVERLTPRQKMTADHAMKQFREEDR
jgi:hypothetical protein